MEKVRHAQKDFPGLTIKLALEVDYLPGHQEWIRELASRHPWDYFVGSVHYAADAWAIDDPKELPRWKDRDAFEVWFTYFERLGEAAESGLFEIIGHADLPKKFNIYPKQDCTPLFEKFLDRAAGTNVALELNTAGLRKDCKEIYPSRRFMELVALRKIPITFGSDAHAPGEVGSDFTAAIEVAKSLGYTRWRQFAGRQFKECLF